MGGGRNKVMAGGTAANPAALVEAEGHSYIGQPVRRREDLALVTGRGRYAGDIRLPGLLYMAVCRSTAPHAVLKGVGLEEARSMPGIVAAFARDDLPEIHGAIVDASLPDAYLVSRPVLASDRVRYVGEPVAVIVASDPYLAADAANAVSIDLEPLDAAGDASAAMEQGAASLHPPHHGNLAGRVATAYGDVDTAFADAAVVERFAYRMARVSGGYLEPRACCAIWDEAADRWEMWTSTQWVHGVRDRVAEMLGLETKQVRVRAENVGGGFGPNGAL
jgi:carbon-monoxide dehydrogenase large subunit